MESEEDKISPENKKRRLKTPFQVEGLENFYAEHKYPSIAMKTQLSIQLGFYDKKVQGWFYHRRLKDKRLMKEECSDNGKQYPQNGFVQDYLNGVKQESRSSGKKVDHQSYLTSNQFGNPQAMNARDYPAAGVVSELRDQDLFTVNHDNMEDTFAGSSSSSQERFSLHSGNPTEIGAVRGLSQNGNHREMEAKRKKSEHFYMDPYLQENYEHEVVIVVKKQLGEEYKEDGPPLSVEFHPIPPSTFNDAPMEPYYHGKTNSIDDLHRESNMVKEQEADKVFSSHRFHVPCLPGVRPGYPSISSGLKFERASPNFETRLSPKFEWALLSKNESLNGKSTWTPVSSSVQVCDSFHVPNLNSLMQMDEDSPGESPSPRFSTKSFSSRHKRDKLVRRSSETYMPLLYGTKNGTMLGKT